jgi:hypothetical protein
VRDIHARTSILVLARLWKRIVRATQDHHVGLHIRTVIAAEARRVPGGRFGLFRWAARRRRSR